MQMIARRPGERVSVAEFVRYADFAEQGTWPVGGGTLDQASVFVKACFQFWRDKAASGKLKQ